MRSADRNDPKVERVVAAAKAGGVEIAPVSFDRETRTAADAAREIGCSIDEIVKSLVFRAADTGQTVLLLLSGNDRVDLGRGAVALGVASLERCAPTDAKAVTGYSIGATPPFGLATELPIAMDDRLLEFDRVWAAGGRTDTVFEISSSDLRRVSGAVVARLREERG